MTSCQNGGDGRASRSSRYARANTHQSTSAQNRRTRAASTNAATAGAGGGRTGADMQTEIDERYDDAVSQRIGLAHGQAEAQSPSLGDQYVAHADGVSSHLQGGYPTHLVGLDLPQAFAPSFALFRSNFLDGRGPGFGFPNGIVPPAWLEAFIQALRHEFPGL